MNRPVIADLIVAFHFGYVLIVVFGLFLIILGGFLRWCLIRNFWFRSVHLVMILIVVIETIFGIPCPLTEWEYKLRITAGQHDAVAVSFVARLIHKLIFYEFPEFVFTVGYCLFGLAIFITWLLIPPFLPWKQDNTSR